MAVQYWIKRGHEENGPFSAAQIKELADGGGVRRDDLISKDRVKWAPAAKAKGLFPNAQVEGARTFADESGEDQPKVLLKRWRFTDPASSVSDPDVPSDPASPPDRRACPYCGEQILAVAKKCKHCGEWIDQDSSPWLDKARSRPSRDAVCSALKHANFEILEQSDDLIKAISPTGLFGVDVLIIFTGLYLAGRVSARITPNSSGGWAVKVGLTPISHFILCAIIFVIGAFTLSLGWIMFLVYPLVTASVLGRPRKEIQAIVDRARRAA